MWKPFNTLLLLLLLATVQSSFLEFPLIRSSENTKYYQ
jgi:hypothetical protein